MSQFAYDPQKEKKFLQTVAVLGVLLFIVSNSLFIVQENEQVLVRQFGNVRQIVQKPGIHFKIPLLDTVTIFEKRILNLDPPSEEVLLADQKRLVVDAFARYRITNMLQFFQALGTETGAAQRLSTIVNATLRSNLGRVPLSDLLTEKRDALMQNIVDDVNKETKRFGIQVVDVRIVRADLPEQVTQSTFDRMRSEREREAKEARAQGEELSLQIRSKADKERTVLLSTAQKDAQILKGEGDKSAISIYAKAFNKDPKFYSFYRSLEAYRKSLADPETTIMLGKDSEFLKFLETKPAGSGE